MFTFPPYRWHGCGRQVLEAATAYIREGSDDLAMLFCQPKLEAFYAAVGWELSRSEDRIGRPDHYIVEPSIRMMIFLTEKGRAARRDFDHQPFVFPYHW